MKQYRTIGMGGTFDRFHVGHRHFLEFAAQLADTIVVGITTPELSSHKVAASLIEPLEIRKKNVEDFLNQQHISNQVFILNDTYGPTLENSQVEAVAVTEQTVSGATAINQKRSELGLAQLPVHVCTLLRDVTGELISSTRIRRGQIDRNGTVYALLLEHGLQLSTEQAAAFKPAQGTVLLTLDPATLTMPTLVVGDIVSETFIKQKWPASLFVFDERSVRQEYKSPQIQQLITANKQLHALSNPAGQLTQELVAWLTHFCRELPEQQTPTPTLLKIDGEEDLVTVGLVLLAPLGTRIYYGQPNQGMVELTVSEQLKEKFRQSAGL